MPAVLVLVLGLTTISPSAGQGASRDMGEESAVRAVVKQYVDARERGDAAAIRALFTEDADQLTSSGEWRKGREQLVQGTLASSKSNAGARTITIETVRFPAPGLSIADGRYSIAGGERRAQHVDVVRVREIGEDVADFSHSQHAAGSDGAGEISPRT
jgi:uncharacterized protein (TIGR02246 family)